MVDFNKIIVNAVDYADVKVFCVALYRAMKAGKVKSGEFAVEKAVKTGNLSLIMMKVLYRLTEVLTVLMNGMVIFALLTIKQVQKALNCLIFYTA